MASRKEEKERLRAEREAAERAAKASDDRRRRLLAVVGGVVLVAAVAGILVLALGGGDDDPAPGDDNGTTASLPAQKTDDLDAAAKAAGCVVEEPKDEGNSHLENDEATFDDYKSNPPTSGTHRPTPAPDGYYLPGRSPDAENWVHQLEHGRVIFQYAPGTPENRRNQLETLMNEEVGDQPSGYKTSVLENNTDMPFAVAGVAWGAFIGCKQFNDAAFDALRAFRLDQIENTKAPEADFPWPAS
jgi:hypothetical protein